GLRAAAVAVRKRDAEDVVEIGGGFDGSFAGKHGSSKGSDASGHGLVVAVRLLIHLSLRGSEHGSTPEGITGELPDFFSIESAATGFGRRVATVEIIADIAPQTGDVA